MVGDCLEEILKRWPFVMFVDENVLEGRESFDGGLKGMIVRREGE